MQEVALFALLGLLRSLYNAALEERIRGYRHRQEAIARGDTAVPAIMKRSQDHALTVIKHECPAYAGVHTHLLQDVILRLDRAFKAFFRRVAAGETPGFPRFKGRGRYQTFTFKDAGKGNGASFVAGGKRVRLHSIGNVKVKIHREMEGVLKTLGVTLDGDGHWYLVVSREVAGKPLASTGEYTGIDMGLNAFAMTAEGEAYANPRPLRAARIAVERAQRTVSRRMRGGTRRKKAVVLLRGRHTKVQNTRKDHHHKVARDLVEKYDGISVEDLNVKGLARGMLAKSVNDAGWGQFLSILSAKAEEAGRSMVRVDPNGTSQKCSGCDTVVRKSLGERVHKCPHCGLVLDRDENAARNILARGFPERARPGHGLRGAAPHGGQQ